MPSLGLKPGWAGSITENPTIRAKPRLPLIYSCCVWCRTDSDTSTETPHASFAHEQPYLGARIWFMVLWKVARADIRPKGMTRNSYNPWCVLENVFGTSPSANQIWWKPKHKSILLNNLDLDNSSSSSSISTKGACFSLSIGDNPRWNATCHLSYAPWRRQWTRATLNNSSAKNIIHLAFHFILLLRCIAVRPCLAWLITRNKRNLMVLWPERWQGCWFPGDMLKFLQKFRDWGRHRDGHLLTVVNRQNSLILMGCHFYRMCRSPRERDSSECDDE
jgi:hypothetical protein